MKEIPGYEGLYSITKEGKVWSHPRNTKYGNRFKKGKWLKPQETTHGYLNIGLSKDGKRKMNLIHRLVGFTYLKKPINKNEINHKDSNRKNNNADNLEWVNKEENTKHAVTFGGRKKFFRKSNKEIVNKTKEIQKKFIKGISLEDLAIEYSSTKSFMRKLTKEIPLELLEKRPGAKLNRLSNNKIHRVDHTLIVQDYNNRLPIHAIATKYNITYKIVQNILKKQPKNRVICRKKEDAKRDAKIIKLYSTGNYSQYDLGKLFDTTRGNIYFILKRHNALDREKWITCYYKRKLLSQE